MSIKGIGPARGATPATLAEPAGRIAPSGSQTARGYSTQDRQEASSVRPPLLPALRQIEQPRVERWEHAWWRTGDGHATTTRILDFLLDPDKGPNDWFPPSFLARIRANMPGTSGSVSPSGGPGHSLAQILAAGLLLLQKYVDDRGRLSTEALLQDHPGANSWLASLAQAPAPHPLRFVRDEANAVVVLEALAARPEPEAQRLVDGMLAAHPGIRDALPAVDLAVEMSPPHVLANHRVFAVQHLLGTQIATFRAFEKLGVEREHIEIVGVPYSTSPVVAFAMKRRGYTVDPSTEGYGRTSATTFHERRLAEIRTKLIAAAEAAQQAGQRLLVIDDGGLCSSVLADRPDLATSCTAVEQTTRGITEARRVALGHPVIDVATSQGKTREAPFIGRAVAHAVLENAVASGLQRGDAVALFGYGRIGKQIALELRGAGLSVAVVERDPALIAAAARDGFGASTMEQAPLETSRLVIGATGHRSVTPEVLRRLPSGCTVASASSAEVEIDMRTLAGRAVTGNVVEEERLHGRRDWVFEGRRLTLVNGARPVNFDGHVENIDPELIQLTRALMVLGAVQAASQRNPGLEPLAQKPQERVLRLLERRWRYHRPLPLPELTPAGAEPTAFSGRADWRLWETYLSRLSDVIPRTESGRAEAGYALYRNGEGALRLVNYTAGSVATLPGVPGRLANMQVLDAQHALVISSHDGVHRHTSVIRREAMGWSLLASASDETHVGIQDRGDELRLFSRRDGMLQCYTTPACSSTPCQLFHEVPDPLGGACSSFSFEQDQYDRFTGRPGGGAEYLIAQVGRQHGKVICWSDGLRKEFELESGLTDIEQTRASGRGQLLAIGKNAEGKTQPVVLDLVRREVRALKPLAVDAKVRAVSYDQQAKRWQVSYSTPDRPDEEQFHDTSELVRQDVHYVTSLDPMSGRARITDGFPFDDES